MYKYFLIILLFQLPFGLTAQNEDYQSLFLPSELTEDANAVLRNEVVEIEIEAIDKMIIRTERVVTVLNEYGQRHTGAGDMYDDNIKIKKQEATIYDKLGNRIERVKSRNFSDRSLVGGNLITDNRVSYLEFTPREYPYTVVYKSEVHSNSTIFMNYWQPASGYYLSVENSSYRIKNKAGIPLRLEEKNLDSLQVEKSVTDFEAEYRLKNLPAYRNESLSGDLENFAPKVRVALNNFSLVGVKGEANDWKEFGKWQYDHLLQGKNTLSQETIEKISKLTADAETDVEKARRIYDFVQNNTRYISVQLGIGGWEPMTAGAVDELGYGDCKALTYYTHALLESQGITSYYAVVYGGEDKVDIDADFASMQGNHVILNIPSEEEDIWLECTSQVTPFNYLGDFTDNRNVLLIKPEGGEIVKTKTYTTAENLQESHSKITLDETGGFTADFSRRSFGVPYGNIFHLMRQPEKDQRLFYKESWGHLKNLRMDQMSFKNNRKEPQFLEELRFSGEKYTSKAGNRLLLPLHFTVPGTYNLPRNDKRQFPIEVARGRTFKETFEYVLPTGFIPEALPEGVHLENRFGSFKVELEVKEENGSKSIVLERLYVLNEGTWAPEAYEDFREFLNQINSISSQKAVLVAAP